VNDNAQSRWNVDNAVESGWLALRLGAAWRGWFWLADIIMLLPLPTPGDEQQWVTTHLGHLSCDEPQASPRFRGTQAAADAALAAFSVTGYAKRRSEVFPVSRRGASGLSPWIRHGLLTLPTLWSAVAPGPAGDLSKFRDELLWQEYSRHLYARLGSLMAEPLRARRDEVPVRHDPWDTSMACMSLCVEELERDGWLVNQTRMWLSSQWSVRHSAPWRDGEDRFFAHLLDGSRAANRAGWQWTIGTGTGREYGFARWQVEKRAPGLCATCAQARSCPIEQFPDDPSAMHPIEPHPFMRSDADVAATSGPIDVEQSGEPQAVWLTAESLGDDDPALAANPDLPVVFVFDEPLLAQLKLSGKRLIFLTERLAELAEQRQLEVQLGAPAQLLAGRALATTFAPVPGWRRLAHTLQPVQVHPWPWLRRPAAGSLMSFSAWSGSPPARANAKGRSTRPGRRP
jgi:deoxyribodipyrimidine photo-lyase